MIEQTWLVLSAFPKLPNTFADILMERALEKGFTDNRLIDAINNVIDNCIYPEPTLANFLSFDKRAKIYNYGQYCDAIAAGTQKADNFAKIIIGEIRYFVLATDKVLYNLPDKI